MFGLIYRNIIEGLLLLKFFVDFKSLILNVIKTFEQYESIKLKVVKMLELVR